MSTVKIWQENQQLRRTDVKTIIYYTLMTLAAIAIGWWLFVDKPEKPLPPITDEPAVEEKIEEEPKPEVTKPKIDCAAIIREYERLVFERDVLGNDYVTPDLEAKYRSCR